MKLTTIITLFLLAAIGASLPAPAPLTTSELRAYAAPAGALSSLSTRSIEKRLFIATGTVVGLVVLLIFLLIVTVAVWYFCCRNR
jgi:lipopolysaccharide/colanic/teichoic acid biosynthesis glycosyltransferase